MTVRRDTDLAPLIGFTILAFGIAWGAELLLYRIAAASELEVDLVRNAAERMEFDELAELTISPWMAYLLTRLQDFSFSIAGVVMTAVVGGTQGLRALASMLFRWRVAPIWYMVALLPVAWYTVAVAVADGGSGEVFESFSFSASSLQAMLIGAEFGLLVTLLFRGPMGEELGLRGFALPRLQQRFSAYTASWVIGVVWALWHLPVLVGRDPVTLVAFLLVVLSLSFLFTWLFNRSRASLIPVLILHTTQNSEEIFESLFPALRETDWELVSTLLLLVCGIAAGVALWRERRADIRANRPLE